MGVEVELSKRSQELIVEYFSISRPGSSSLKHVYSPIDSAQLISWLNDELSIPSSIAIESKQEIEFILASLRGELLRDLLASMDGDNSPNINPAETNSWDAKIKFALLALAGTLLAGCEGFDSIATMLSVLSLPPLVILLAGLSFSLLSIVVFYGYDLVQVSKNLGVTLRDAPKLLDVYLLQMNEIKGIRKKIDSYKLAELSTEELVQLESIITMLQRRFQALIVASSQFDSALNSNKMQTAKVLVSAMAGLLYFGSGFFAGQSVAMFIAGLFIPVVLPTFWPVVLFSIIVGLADFTLYWYVDRVGLKNLVSGWFGLDEDKIDQLCDKNNLDKEEKKLENLKEKVISTAKLTNQLIKLQHELEGVDDLSSQPAVIPISHDHEPLTLRTSANIYSFHPKPASGTCVPQAWQSRSQCSEPLDCHAFGSQ
jgi:hypothetical protein